MARQWPAKVDNWFKRFDKFRESLGKRTDKALTILMIASIIILAIVVVYVMVQSKDGPTNWAYQLQDIDVEQVVNAPQEIVVLDYSKDGTDENALTEVEIARIKASGKQVYAYLSIGEAEDYRYYWMSEWEENPPTWLAEENPEWEGNYLVKYWDENWQDIIVDGEDSYLDKILDAGFDGVYLDKVDSYETWEYICLEDSAPKYCIETIDSVQISLPKKRMAEFVISLSEEGKKRDPYFNVFIQHGYGILQHEDVWDAIAGVGKEELFYENGQERPESEIDFDMGMLNQVIAANKMVLVVEYISDEEQIKKFCTQTQLNNYIPFVGNVDLNSMPQEKVCR